MENLYYGDSCPSCAAFRDGAAQGFTFDKEVLKQALKTVYKQDFSPTMDIEEHLFDETFATFGRAIDEGYGKPAPGSANEGFYHELRHNAAVFSAFKVHRLQNDIAAQLTDGNGQLKPFGRFAEDVRPMLDHQVGRWLRTEYDTAVIRAHQAADWRRYMEQAHILPNLRWLPTTSATPDIVHKQFWSIELTLPIEHPFWNAHRPGDRWNCHCSLEATDDAPTPGHEIPKTTTRNKPAPGLDNNPGTDAKLFSDTHPYVAHAYKGAKKAVEKFFREKFPDKASVKVEPKHDEPKSYATRTKEIRKAAAPLKEEVFTNKRFKKDIRITGRGIKEWLNQPHEHYAHKNELLLHMGDVMKKAKYMGYGKDKHDPSVKAHLFEVKILGDKSWIIARELKPGRVEIHSISDSPRILDIMEKPTS